MNEIHTSSVRAGSRTYFFDIKQAVTGNLYLEITESRKMEDGTYKRHNIMIFQEDIGNFKEELNDIFYKYFKPVIKGEK